VVDIQKYDEDASTIEQQWDEAAAGAVSLGGADLLEKENLKYLERINHLVFGLDFRQGEFMDNGHDGAYVSISGRIAPLAVLRRKYKGAIEDLPFYPGDDVVYNAGDTGLYRQMVKIIADKGYIKLPDPVIVGGKLGESTYDLNPAKWEGFDSERVVLRRNDEGGFASVHIDILISAPRGLRSSEYDGGPGIGKAATYYIA
jgi:hypothetical protein